MIEIKYKETIGWENPITIYEGFIDPDQIWMIKHVINAVTNKYRYTQRPTNTEGNTLEPKNKIWFQIICETETKFKQEMKVFNKKVKFIKDRYL